MHLFHNLETFGFPLAYNRKYFIAMGMDEQYTSLDICKLIHEKLQNDINLSCDPMHWTELASQDSKLVVHWIWAKIKLIHSHEMEG